MAECCAAFEARGYFLAVDNLGRSWHERAFAVGVPGAVCFVTYFITLPAGIEPDKHGLEEALGNARSDAIEGLPVDPMEVPTFAAAASSSCMHTDSDSMRVGVCEAYSTQSALAHVDHDSQTACNALLGAGTLEVSCVAVAPGTAVLGAVLRQVDSAAVHMREDIHSYAQASLAFPPPAQDELTVALNDSMPSWAAGEDGVGEVAALLLPWEVHRGDAAGMQQQCMLPVQLPEEGAYVLRVVVAPLEVVHAAAAAAEQPDAVARYSQLLLECSPAATSAHAAYVAASTMLYSLPEGDWDGWDHFAFVGSVAGGGEVQHTAGAVQLPSVQVAKAAAGGDWPYVPVHDMWLGLGEEPTAPASGAGADGADALQQHSGDGWEAALPSGPFSSIMVLDVASPVPEGHRAQFALADRESLIALAAEHGIESLPHSGPEMYGLFPGMYLAMGSVGGGHIQAPFAELRLISASADADLSSQVGELSAAGEQWELLFGDVADMVAAQAGDDAGIVVRSTAPHCVALLGRRSGDSDTALVDAAMTISPGAAHFPVGYEAQSVQLQCSDDAGDHIQVTVTLVHTTSNSAAAEEAQRAVNARTTALSGAGHSLDADFTGDDADGRGVAQADGDSFGELEQKDAYDAHAEVTMSRELAEQQDLEMAAFLQEEYDMLNAQCSGEEQAFEALTERNQVLQRKLAAYFNIRQSGDETQGRTDAKEELGVQQSAAQSHEAAQRYRETLEALAAKRAEYADARDRQQQESLALQKRIEMRKSEAIQISDSLAQWKRTVAQGAVNSITGRPMSKSDISHFQDEESVRDADIERARVKNIKLKAGLEELTAQLAAKEHLADGLALIDFEQLKIENSTLNEKIEDRNEELHKLRKKTTTTVQVLTHVKEKLQFVAGEAAELKQQLHQLELQVADRRDKMTTLKAARESQRSSIEAKKTEQGFAHNDMLAKDFERRKRSMRELRNELDELKRRHSSMTKVVAVAKSQGLVDTILR